MQPQSVLLNFPSRVVPPISIAQDTPQRVKAVLLHKFQLYSWSILILKALLKAFKFTRKRNIILKIPSYFDFCINFLQF